ncbi:hypothetical protein Tco_1026489 [Tanacetum coccineum]
MGSDMRWYELHYIKVRKGEFISPCFKLLRKLGFADIQYMYLKKSHVLGVTFRNTGQDVSPTCEKGNWTIIALLKIGLFYDKETFTQINVREYQFDDGVEELPTLVPSLIHKTNSVDDDLSIRASHRVIGELNAHYLLICDQRAKGMEKMNSVKNRQDKYSSELFFTQEEFIQGMSQAPCIFVHPHSNFELEPVSFDQILHVLKVLELPQLALAIKQFYVRMIKNKTVDKWLVKWKRKKLCGIKMNILKNCTNSFDPRGQDLLKRRMVLSEDDEIIVKGGSELIEGTDREDKWRKLNVRQLELYAKRMKLIGDQLTVVIQDIKLTYVDGHAS